MKKAISILLALTLMLALGGQAFAAGTETGTQLVRCPEQGFSVLCRKDYVWNYSERDGITIYTDYEGSIPYVLVFCAEDWIVETADYIREQFTPHMKKQYGDDLVAFAEFEHYNIGGRDLAAGLYTYRLQGYLIDMVRAYDVQERHTVVYTAKYIRGQGAETLAALEQAVQSYRPDTEYYDTVEKNPRWAYSVTAVPDGGECYVFPEFQITLPADWRGKVTIGVNERSIAFYQTQSYERWQKEGYKGGLLFAVGYSEQEDFRNLPSYAELGKVGKGWYYLIYPTDLQAYDIKTVLEEYMAMFGERDYVLDQSACF